MIQNILLLLGLLSILKPLILMIQAIFMHLKPMKDLKKTYGDNSWAVVTGGSDGIGFGFCEELAAQGFNICMISRSKSKIDLKIKELKQKINKNVEYKGIVANFKQSNKLQFFEPIFEQLQKLDISIFVNNVGISEIINIQNQSYESIMDITNVNCIPMGIFTCFFAKKLQNRSKKAAIVNISSYSSVRSLPYMAIYAATKSFNDTFSRCVSREDQKNDILSVVALKVISGSVKQNKGLSICTSRECAVDSLKWLGVKDQTAGHLKHELMSIGLSCLPNFLVEHIAKKQAKKTLQLYGKEKIN